MNFLLCSEIDSFLLRNRALKNRNLDILSRNIWIYNWNFLWHANNIQTGIAATETNFSVFSKSKCQAIPSLMLPSQGMQTLLKFHFHPFRQTAEYRFTVSSSFYRELRIFSHERKLTADSRHSQTEIHMRFSPFRIHESSVFAMGLI